MSMPVHVPFHGDQLPIVEVDGRPHVALRPVVEALGLNYDSQLEKLRSKSWATVPSRGMVAADGKIRMMSVVDVRTLTMLLATIDEGRVAEHVRPKLIAYQAEVADAIEAYWTEGGAINPRANADQLEQIADLAGKRIALLRSAEGLVDRAWLEAKTRHEIARGLGEEPEVSAVDRPLTVGEYLEDRGITGRWLRKLSPKFGKRLKALYVSEYGHEPMPTDRFIDGAMRPVAGYTERHRHLFDQVYDIAFGGQSS